MTDRIDGIAPFGEQTVDLGIAQRMIARLKYENKTARNELSDALEIVASMQPRINILVDERDALRKELNDCRNALQDTQVSATMRRAEADELRNTLAQLRELYTDRESDLEHEYKRANKADAKAEALREALAEWVDWYQYNAPADMVRRATDAMTE